MLEPTGAQWIHRSCGLLSQGGLQIALHGDKAAFERGSEVTKMKRNQLFVTIALALGAVVASACTSDEETSAGAGLVCEPACSASGCQVCRVVGAVAQCVSTCGTGLTCEAGLCMAPAMTSCDPACGPCQACDITGASPVCIDFCDEGTECQAGACVPVEVATACSPACGDCEICDATGPTPTCVPKCGAEEACTDVGACVRAGFHAQFGNLEGPFGVGPDVTSACIDCHQEEAEAVMATPHWNWTGPTPNLLGHQGSTDIGKKNLINNFCVSVPGNEARCTQCHAGYEYEDAAFTFNDITKVDCLVCHADPASGYKKDKKTAGRVAANVDLVLAAQSVGPSTRGNCGSCHFTAGGGDNVKKGDLGTALTMPSETTDVHMGRGMTCSNCHVENGHTILGQGVHTPVTEGRFDCIDCHGDTPHASTTPVYDEHALDIACQTCHIPAFSRQQPTKMWWDWSSAGNRTIGDNGVAMTDLGDGTMVQSYNYMKGDFRWEKNVKPTFMWYDGGAAHMVLDSTYPDGAGTESKPVVIARPTATIQSPQAKIFPFKVMRGKQPAHLTDRYLIAPKLFGPGGFWKEIPDAENYAPEVVRAKWTASLSRGARAAGQITSTASIADSDWGFVYTEMYMGINHEVAPTEMTLGSDLVAPCLACHGNSEFPWTELGYLCDPFSNAQACGSRNF